jgi:hypothetical protein
MMAIAKSPLLPAPYVHELTNFYNKCPSMHAFDAALAVAVHTTPLEMPNLAVIETIGGSYHRTYTGRPSNEEWLRLERGGIVPFDNGNLFILMDVLH